jgi:ABC-type microcin C transport system permease subunit YejE
MKKLILLLLLAISTTACSQENAKPVLCMETKEMFDAIFEEYRETILMVFDQDTFANKIVLTVNQTTKTWSLVEYSTGIACLLGSGHNYKIMGRVSSKDYI